MSTTRFKKWNATFCARNAGSYFVWYPHKSTGWILWWRAEFSLQVQTECYIVFRLILIFRR